MIQVGVTGWGDHDSLYKVKTAAKNKLALYRKYFLIIDKPQVGSESAPTVLEATHKVLSIVRFHGRKEAGWNPENQENWRQVRFLYRYSRLELLEWVKHIDLLDQQSQNICLLFNNNSDKDATDNAKEMMKLLGLHYNVQIASQLKLF